MIAPPGECIDTADLPVRPVIDLMRAAWARRVGLDALNRACAALLCGKDDVADDGSATEPGRQQTQAKKGKRAASAVANGAGRAAKRRGTTESEEKGRAPSA